jgi:PAS domain S-box-containing protein
MSDFLSASDTTEYLSTVEAANFLGVSPWTVRSWNRLGQLKSNRHPENGHRVYRHQDLESFRKSGSPVGNPDQITAPSVDWSAIGDREHFVQFYESDAYLASAVSGFVGTSLEAGDAGIVIATQAHRDSIARRTGARGVNLSAAMAQGRYIALDAAETLSKFMVGGVPDPDRFVEVVGGIVKQLTAGGRRLRAFGEMVAILWAEGNRAGAIRLEELWNDLAKTYSFALFCAYPMSDCEGGANGEPFSNICSCHTRVLPSESYSELATNDQRLRAITKLQQKAQSLEAEIAHRREVEKALSRREQELSDFRENALEGMHQVGPDGIIIWANKAELTLLGYEAKEYVGHHVSEFHADGEVIADMIAKLLRGENLYDFPARMRCKDGSIKHLLVHSNAFFEEARFIYSRCFSRDVTAIREAEARERQLLATERAARAEAERVSRMKDEFLATLSHELRTPLNAIFGWAQIIKDSPADVATVSEGIAVIDRNVRMQTQLIADLLDMSRIIAGKVRLDVQPIDLIPVLQAAAEAVRPAANAKGITIRQVLDSLAGPISGDPARLQQVVWNLLTNAVKFAPQGGKIDLLLERVNSHLEITVSDNGHGISPEFLPHVFERFRQADSSAARKHGGLGLGLSIVKQLVELHGGTVSAKSAGEGRGASFTVALPVRVLTEPPLPNDSRVSNGADLRLDRSTLSLRGIRILVVDDECDARELLMRSFDEYDADVISASSADEALKLFCAFKPQVLVSDIGMPHKDGYELIRQIRARHSQEGNIPAVALTAFARSEDRRRALLAGYQIHLSKPLEPQELVVTVVSLLQRANA